MVVVVVVVWIEEIFKPSLQNPGPGKNKLIAILVLPDLIHWEMLPGKLFHAFVQLPASFQQGLCERTFQQIVNDGSSSPFAFPSPHHLASW